MGDSNLLPPNSMPGTWTPTLATPSGLTPNTRSEAEAALTLNVSTQTDSAAPTTPLAVREKMSMGTGHEGADDGLDEAVKAYRRPAGPLRASSTNYENAVRQFRKQSSVSTDISTSSVPDDAENFTDTNKVDSPMMSTYPFPPPGQGVVPLHTGVGAGQAEAVKKTKPRGLSLGTLGRQQSWSEEDFKRLYTSSLMSKVEGDPGYGSGSEK